MVVVMALSIGQWAVGGEFGGRYICGTSRVGSTRGPTSCLEIRAIGGTCLYLTLIVSTIEGSIVTDGVSWTVGVGCDGTETSSTGLLTSEHVSFSQRGCKQKEGRQQHFEGGSNECGGSMNECEVVEC